MLLSINWKDENCTIIDPKIFKLYRNLIYYVGSPALIYPLLVIILTTSIIDILQHNFQHQTSYSKNWISNEPKFLPFRKRIIFKKMLSDFNVSGNIWFNGDFPLLQKDEGLSGWFKLVLSKFSLFYHW